jgi:glycosyltransferase involved in cell wall biosynthesis
MADSDILGRVMDEPKGDSEKKLVTLVVPAYNEERILEKNLSRLSQYMSTLEDEYRWEMIIINDGSTDSTGDIAEAFARQRANVHVYHHLFNFRLGQALRFAFQRCRGDYVAVIDADLSYSPDHIGKMLSKMKESRAKIVIASPYRKDGKVSNVPRIRKVLSYWANRFLSLLATKDWYSDRLTNITGMVRAYDGEFIRNLNLWAMDVDINPEIIYKAKILRARIVEIPAHLNWQLEKEGRKPSRRRVTNLRLMRGILQSLLSGFIFRPFMFFIFPGFVLFVISLYPLLWALIHTVTFYNKLADLTPLDNRLSQAVGQAFRLSPHSFIIGGILLLIAMQFTSLGFLAYQQKRYYSELFHLGSSIYKNVRSDNSKSLTKT